MSACPATHIPTVRFQVGGSPRCAGHAVLSATFLRTSLPTAAIVGTILTAINQGNLLADWTFPGALAWKVPLTYSVPFLVSSWSQLRALRLPAPG